MTVGPYAYRYLVILLQRPMCGVAANVLSQSNYLNSIQTVQ